MALSLTLCRLSAKRLELLRDDPTLIRDVLRVTDQKVPGLLRIGETWDALAHIVKPWDDATQALQGLLRAQGGKALATSGPFAKARLFDADAVKKMAALLAAAPSDGVRARVVALKGTKCEGEYFGAPSKSKDKDKDDEGDSLIEQLDEDDENDPSPELEAALRSVHELLREVASKGESLLVIPT